MQNYDCLRSKANVWQLEGSGLWRNIRTSGAYGTGGRRGIWIWRGTERIVSGDSHIQVWCRRGLFGFHWIVHGVFLVLRPFAHIFRDVSPDTIESMAIAYDMLIVIALPSELRNPLSMTQTRNCALVGSDDG